MTQEDLAHALGYHLSYIGQLERGQKSPTLRTMVNLAQLFELPVNRLMALAERHLSKQKTAAKTKSSAKKAAV